MSRVAHQSLQWFAIAMALSTPITFWASYSETRVADRFDQRTHLSERIAALRGQALVADAGHTPYRADFWSER